MDAEEHIFHYYHEGYDSDIDISISGGQDGINMADEIWENMQRGKINPLEKESGSVAVPRKRETKFVTPGDVGKPLAYEIYTKMVMRGYDLYDYPDDLLRAYRANGVSRIFKEDNRPLSKVPKRIIVRSARDLLRKYGYSDSPSSAENFM